MNIYYIEFTEYDGPDYDRSIPNSMACYGRIGDSRKEFVRAESFELACEIIRKKYKYSDGFTDLILS